MKIKLLTGLLIVFLIFIWAVFYSIYDVVKYGDAPLSIYEEISYIQKHVINNGAKVNSEIEVNLITYSMEYCDFPAKPFFGYINAIYPRNIEVMKYKAGLMAYAAKYRISHPMNDEFFDESIPASWRIRVNSCWERIVRDYG